MHGADWRDDADQCGQYALWCVRDGDWHTAQYWWRRAIHIAERAEELDREMRRLEDAGLTMAIPLARA